MGLFLPELGFFMGPALLQELDLGWDWGLSTVCLLSFGQALLMSESGSHCLGLKKRLFVPPPSLYSHGPRPATP